MRKTFFLELSFEISADKEFIYIHRGIRCESIVVMRALYLFRLHANLLPEYLADTGYNSVNRPRVGVMSTLP